MRRPQTSLFIQTLLAEWARLNPPHYRPGQDLREMFVSGFKEGWAAFFAPLKMLVWLARSISKAFTEVAKD